MDTVKHRAGLPPKILRKSGPMRSAKDYRRKPKHPARAGY